MDKHTLQTLLFLIKQGEISLLTKMMEDQERVRQYIAQKEYNGSTEEEFSIPPTFYAAYKGKGDVLKFLLHRGACPNSTFAMAGTNALLTLPAFIVMQNNEELMKVFVDADSAWADKIDFKKPTTMTGANCAVDMGNVYSGGQNLDVMPSINLDPNFNDEDVIQVVQETDGSQAVRNQRAQANSNRNNMRYGQMQVFAQRRSNHNMVVPYNQAAAAQNSPSMTALDMAKKLAFGKIVTVLYEAEQVQENKRKAKEKEENDSNISAITSELESLRAEMQAMRGDLSGVPQQAVRGSGRAFSFRPRSRRFTED